MRNGADVSGNFRCALPDSVTLRRLCEKIILELFFSNLWQIYLTGERQRDGFGFCPTVNIFNDFFSISYNGTSIYD
jgi:hypothetical protein